jgi:hypothetical protein
LAVGDRRSQRARHRAQGSLAVSRGAVMKSATKWGCWVDGRPELIPPDLHVRKIINPQHHTTPLINFRRGVNGGGRSGRPVNPTRDLEGLAPAFLTSGAPKRDHGVCPRSAYPASQARPSAISTARPPPPHGETLPWRSWRDLARPGTSMEKAQGTPRAAERYRRRSL